MLLAGPLSTGAAGADFEAGVRALQERNFAAALREFQALAAAGAANAEFMVGVMYENGYGVEADDPEVAANWYQRAAERGLASAQYNLSVFYQLGKGVALNLSEAAKLSRMAADKGHAAAQTNLGVYYMVGEGIDRDLVEAWKWLSIASRSLDGVALDTVRANMAQVEKQLNSADLAKAKRRAEDWQPAK
jgi:TPR repeat protein